MKQLTAVEKYALKRLEIVHGAWRDAQLAAADAEIEAQKKEFDAKKLDELAEAIGGATSATPTEAGSTANNSDNDETERYKTILFHSIDVP